MSVFEKRSIEKQKIRESEITLLNSGEKTPLELGEDNFCMKGVNLSDYRNPDGSFSLF